MNVSHVKDLVKTGMVLNRVLFLALDSVMRLPLEHFQFLAAHETIPAEVSVD